MIIKFVIEETYEERAGNIVEIERPLQANEPLPMKGDLLTFDSDELYDIDIYVDYRQFMYNKDNQIDMVVIHGHERTYEE